ncbi:Single-stranded DNA-binding protein [Rickettsiales endosymbiont of Paramecium tredecaurelia]|uniref:single-stranded DNA-binding protein n=1 Tax=Candidatus Sarmatiella mevalonica TaxID=2770581 RepID=UPI0019213C12|nr:single-stranded DNA-binding protein [Candidatus Sarmatiella mevalonica]MBL3284437.1 Single-stranded DNA-binding protein [Candidatus Sarmatiella mevalonica]
MSFSSLNKVTLLGNVGQVPEIRAMNGGNEMASFSLATSESWKDKATGERKEKTEWHRVAVFNPIFVQMTKESVDKGTKLYVEGTLQTRKWTDASGQERYTTEVVLQGYGSTLIVLNGKGEKREFDAMNHNDGEASQLMENEDELPF